MRLFAPQAQADLDQVVGWLLDNGSAGGPAERLLSAALDAAELLALRPQLGRLRPEFLPEPFRFWSIPRYKLLLVYRSDTTPATVLRVLNTAQDLAPLLAGILDSEGPGST